MVGGVSYDGTFSTDSYDDLFTGAAPGPIFAGDPALAAQVEGPLGELLNASGVTGLGGVPCAVRKEACVIFVPVSTYLDGSIRLQRAVITRLR